MNEQVRIWAEPWPPQSSGPGFATAPLTNGGPEQSMCCYAGPRASRKNRRITCRAGSESLGKEFSRLEQHVTRAMMLEYADIIGAGIRSTLTHMPPRHVVIVDIIAPPTFCRLAMAHSHCSTRDGFDGTGIKRGMRVRLWVFCPGDVLTYSTCIVTCTKKPSSGRCVSMVRETTVTNQQGDTFGAVRKLVYLEVKKCDCAINVWSAGALWSLGRQWKTHTEKVGRLCTVRDREIYV